MAIQSGGRIDDKTGRNSGLLRVGVVNAPPRR